MNLFDIFKILAKAETVAEILDTLKEIEEAVEAVKKVIDLVQGGN